MLRFDATEELAAPAEPRDSATVLFLRESVFHGEPVLHGEPVFQGDPAETDAVAGEAELRIFCVRRHAASPFLGGAVVFPGGKLDPADCAFASADGVVERVHELVSNREHAVGLAVCACREALEEAGLCQTAPAIDDATVMLARAALTQGVTLAALFADRLANHRLMTSALVPFSRWVTPAAESRRYDARFFLARAPEGQRGQHDAHETTSGVWATPSEMLAAFERGDVFLAPPTLRCFELLRGITTYEAAVELAGRQSLEPICPRFVAADPPMLVLPGDPLHEIAERRIAGPTRFVLRDGKFLSEEPA
ncbi:MAG: hypothetical protein EXR75_15240 [Myxococcales bacterium]|nr:hypothetical protein [Myxococcales bacterium]